MNPYRNGKFTYYYNDKYTDNIITYIYLSNERIMIHNNINNNINDVILIT